MSCTTLMLQVCWPLILDRLDVLFMVLERRYALTARHVPCVSCWSSSR